MPPYLRVSPQIQVNHLSWDQGKRGIAYNRLMKKQVIQKKLGTTKGAQRSPQQQMLDSNHAGHMMMMMMSDKQPLAVETDMAK